MALAPALVAVLLVCQAALALGACPPGCHCFFAMLQCPDGRAGISSIPALASQESENITDM